MDQHQQPAAERCPIIDFDQESPEHAAHWVDDFRTMREQCPRPWNKNHGGHWIATRYNDIMRIAQSSDLFSTAKTVNPETGEVIGGVTIPSSPSPSTIPLESDNPEWQGYRQFLNRRFAPKAAEEHRPFAEAIVRTLIDRVIEKGEIDIVADLANPMPAIFTMGLLGLDLKDWDKFAEPAHKFTYFKRGEPEFKKIVDGIDGIYAMLSAALEERRGNPGDDLLSHLANGEIWDRPLSHEEATRMALLIIFGGVDTTTALTSNVLHYLSAHPDDRQRLIDDPSRRPIAREEFVRYFSPIHGLARHAKTDVEIDGWKINKGDPVLLAYSSANRDADVFPDADELKIDRFPNRHIAFGAGMHRCIGSFYARVMFESMLTEVLTRMPDYRVIEDRAQSYPSVAQVNGWISIPAVFTPGPKLGGGVDF